MDLIHAIRIDDNKKIISILKKKDFSMNSTSPSGHNVLMLASYYGSPYIVNLLLDYDISIIDNKSRAGFTALHFAAQEGHKEIIKLLLKRGANPYIKNTREETPFNISKDIDTMKVFIDFVEGYNCP
jgi:ankyrin